MADKANVQSHLHEIPDLNAVFFPKKTASTWSHLVFYFSFSISDLDLCFKMRLTWVKLVKYAAAITSFHFYRKLKGHRFVIKGGNLKKLTM